MFGAKQECTVVAAGMKIVGNVTAEGAIQVNGQIDGEIHCNSLIVARGVRVSGTIAADNIVVDGVVEGPIQAVDIVLKPQVHVVGDIACKSVAIERGANPDLLIDDALAFLAKRRNMQAKSFLTAHPEEKNAKGA